MSSSTKQNVTKGAIFLYMENAAAMLMGYIFWFLIAKVTTADIIGTSGAIVSFSAIVSTVINLGIPISVQRFLGKCFIKHQYGDAKVYVKASIILLLATIILISALVILLFPFLGGITKIEFNPLIIIITLGLTISSSVSRLLRGIIIASLKTRILFIANLLSTVSKFTVAIILLLLGFGVVGLTMGILSFSILEAIILSLGIYDILYRSSVRQQSSKRVMTLFRPIVIGGMPNWVPTMIASFGAQLGTVVVFGLEGSYEAGYYFIAFSIYTALHAVVSIAFSITFPVLSSMEKGQRDFSLTVIRISLILSLPLSFSFLFYSGDILSLFGKDYANGALTLDILILSSVPLAIIGGHTNLLYSKGDYRRAIIIGIGSSLPRTVLYFVLVPFLGGNGAALSFTLGSFLGLIIALLITKHIELKVSWARIGLLSFIPITVSYVISLLPVSYFLAVPIIIATTYVIYLKMSLLKVEEIVEGLKIFPPRISKPALKIVGSISRYIGHK